MQHIHKKQRGAALVIGLILLVVITLLAVVGMNVANTELASATSEQLRLRAFNAAESGLEARFQTLAEDATTSTTPVTDAEEGVENSPLNVFTGEAADTFSTVTTYRGEGTAVSLYSTNTFVGFHYSIESTGRSTRNAESVHTAGAMLVRSVAEGNVDKPLPEDYAPVTALPTDGLGAVDPAAAVAAD
jgi:type IV pilus assembly protein PilX